MESVKLNMRKLCKQLSLDIRRRQEGRRLPSRARAHRRPAATTAAAIA